MLELSEFAAAAVATRNPNEVLQVQVPGFRRLLPVAFLQRHRDGLRKTPLVICFHGAIDRTKRRIPAFEGRFLLMNGMAGDATVLSIADPSLAGNPELRATWYAGEETHDTPAQITAFLARVLQDFEPSRVVFVGGSTGAHPALFHSWHVAGSVVVIENPILHISSYFHSHITQYRRHCWPRLARAAPFPQSVNDNMASLYTHGGANTVVLLNNARDAHFWVQGYLLLQAMRRGEGRGRCLLYSDFFADYPGHSFPADVWTRWVIAACRAPSTSVADIGASLPAPRQPAPVAKASPASDAAADFATARKVYDALMSQQGAA